MASSKVKLPEPVLTDGRICFGIAYFKTEKDAKIYAKHVQDTDQRYNGGFNHGMLCGRAPEFDYVNDKLGKLFAVTTS